MTIHRRSLLELAASAGGSVALGAGARAEAKSPRRRATTEQERNKQAVRDYFEHCWNNGDLDFGRHLMDDDYEYRRAPGVPGGFAGWKSGVGRYLAAFPDCHWDIRQIVAEGDLVCVRTVWTGTHTGDFMGVPASGHRVEAANADFYKMRNGKFVDHWDVPDWLAILRQIGGTLDNWPSALVASTKG